MSRESRIDFSEGEHNKPPHRQESGTETLAASVNIHVMMNVGPQSSKHVDESAVGAENISLLKGYIEHSFM